MLDLMSDEVRNVVKGRPRWPGKPLAVRGVSTDTRTAQAGNLFVALRGPKFDGGKFLAQAAERGCVAAIVEQSAELDAQALGRFAGGVFAVPDAVQALADLAVACRARTRAAVVAVTGSNGKTTVKRMIHHVLSRKLKGSASPKSFNNNIGVPLTLLEVAAGDDYVVCELGSNAPGEIAALTAIARPDVAVITSVGETHLEKLIDVEHVAAEKAAILGGLAIGGVGIIWADSPPLAKAVRAYPVNLIRFGQNPDADLRLTGYEPASGGGRMELNGRLRIDLAVPGRHNAANALAAIAVAQRFGFSQEEAARALADFAGADMRLQAIRAGELTIINDAYNANPASLRAAGEALASFEARRRVVVAGDMLELGPHGPELHRAAGAALARCGLSLVIGVGRLGRLIAEGAAAAGAPAEGIESVEQACKVLPSRLAAGDVVLLKGSRGMAMERLVEPLRAAFEPPAAARPPCAKE